jgi:outer membrane protein OmpA-like peptidoglycan-associated protein
MKMFKQMVLTATLFVLPGLSYAGFGHGLGGEIKDSKFIEGQQSGWAARAHVDAPAMCAMKCSKPKCANCAGCPCCGGHRYGKGLGSEYKSKFIPAGQQSGWAGGFKKMAPPAPVAKKEEPKPVVAEAPKPADSDNDGVIDDKDECPGTPAGTKVEASGCPATVKAIEDNWVLKGVNFETSSDKIKSESFGALDEAAGVLKARSKVRVQIQGHTDNMGDEKANQQLSDRRAVSVKNYLVNKGVSASQLETIGYGESMPIADNKTVAGRAQNRRIEFKVLSR